MRLRVVLDANVLYPMTLRDTLLRAAEKGWFTAAWTGEILAEVTRNLVEDCQMTTEQAGWLREQIEEHFPEAMVEGYEPLIKSMQNDAKDRHVAAAAVHFDADLIVTQNVDDFVPLPEGIDVQKPAAFLKDLLDLHGQAVVRLLNEQASDMKKPPRTFEELLDALAKSVPEFIAEVRTLLKA